MRYTLLTTALGLLISVGQPFQAVAEESDTISDIFSNAEKVSNDLPPIVTETSVTQTSGDEPGLLAEPVSTLHSEFDAALNDDSGGNNWCGNGCSCGTCNYDSCGCESPLFISDHEFDGFIEPVTNPIFFEDPRSRTRLRFWFMNQQIPGKSILGRGDLQIYAMQVTVALNERWTLLAQKDGYIALQATGATNDQGWGDLATGLKYVLVRDVENQFLLSTGFLYEWSQGSSRVFQGNGDGVWNLFLTGGKEFGRSHVISTMGFHVPNNDNKESTSMFYSLHLDYRLTKRVYALWEMTGINYLKSGGAPGFTTVNMEGGDIINLGAGNVAGNNFISTAVGSTIILNKNLQVAGAWEFPITSRRDLFEHRATVTLSLVY